MNWTVVSPSLVLLFRSLASSDMRQLLGEYDVTWMQRNTPFMSPTLQAGVYLKVLTSNSYGKPAKDWLPHQQTTLTPSTLTEGTVYSGTVASVPWTYTTVAGETLTTLCANIATKIDLLANPHVYPQVIDGPKVLCDVAVDQSVAFTGSANLTLATAVNVQEALVTRGKLTLQVVVKSLESTDTTWSLSYLENIQRQIWSDVSLSMLRSLGLGLISVGDIRDISAPIDDREASIGTLDIRFSFVEKRTIPVDVGTIEHVSGVANARHGATIEQVAFQADKPTT